MRLSTIALTTLAMLSLSLLLAPISRAEPILDRPPPGFAELSSGLRFRAITRQTENLRQPHANSRVSVVAEGQLPDGTVFWRTSRPTVIQLSNAIAGWREGIAMMRPGETFVFWIPATLAYGTAGRPPSIPPNSPLIFKVRLVDIHGEV